MGVVVILSGALAAVLLITVDKNLSPEMAVGLLTGALTSTPGLSAATEAVTGEAAGEITAGYGIAYVFGVLGVVLFVQLIPKLLKVDTEAERASFQAGNAVTIKPITKSLQSLIHSALSLSSSPSRSAVSSAPSKFRGSIFRSALREAR